MESTSRMIPSESRRISRRFAQLRAAGRTALVPYITAGYPSPGDTPDLLRRLAGAGADVIELGLPFSDPLADGPTIQRASQRALEQGASVRGALDSLMDFRADHETAVVLFSYLNPVLAYGIERFIADSEAAGADGVLITDLPVGSDPELEAPFERSRLALIRLIAPTTAPARAAEIARRAQGFVYYISRTGVTGARAELREGLTREVAALRAETDVPIAVGFGISGAGQAAEVARLADGVVLGSALIDALDRGGAGEAETLIREIREAIDRGE